MIQKVMYGCKRLAVSSGKFYVGVKGTWHKLKVLLPKETHDHDYHLDFELGDGSQD